MASLAWTLTSFGSYLSNTDFSEKVRYAAQPKMLFRRFVDQEAETGMKRGGEVSLFDKLRNVATAGGSLTETTTIPKTNFQIVQDSLTVYEWGEPVAQLCDSCRKILKFLSLTIGTAKEILWTTRICKASYLI